MGWWTRWRMGAVCADYKALLDQFLNHAMPLESFQRLYFACFKSETRYMSEALFQVLDEARLRERMQAAPHRLACFID